jgi:hypothetical protein
MLILLELVQAIKACFIDKEVKIKINTGWPESIDPT